MNHRLTFHLPFLFLVGLFFVLGLGACTPVTPTSAPASTHDLLYSLDFEDPAAFPGWHVGGPGIDLWLENTVDGKYLFEYASGYLENLDLVFSDIQVGVDVEFLSTSSVEASLSCRLQPGGGGRYTFSIANNGSWSIRKSFNGETLLTEGQSEAIQAGLNHLAGRCVGDQLTLLVNGQELGSASDADLVSGGLNFSYAALAAGAGTFDNISVENWGAAQPAAEPTPTRTAELPATQAPVSPTAAATSTVTPTPTATATPTLPPTPAPTLRPSPIPTDELTLYQTEFDDGDATLSDWNTFAYSTAQQAFVSDGYRAYTVNGVYRFQGEANIRAYAIYEADLGSADVELSTRGLAPRDDTGGLGLVCRYSEAGWYQFMVEANYGWSIRLVQPGEDGQLHFHVISSGQRYLELKVDLQAECKGDRLTFYIDGDKVAVLHDATLPAGKVGLLGWAFAAPADSNMLDYFTVRRAQWNETGLTGPAPTPAADGTIYSTDFAVLSDLNPYWVKIDFGVQGIPGSPLLVGGPGHAAPHTYLYINDFDPGQDVEITADLRTAVNWPRGLICRYSEDGWYEVFYMKDSLGAAGVTLVRRERDELGQFSASTILGAYYPPASAYQVNLSLTCTGNQVSVQLDGERVLYAEDEAWSSGRYGFFFADNPPGTLRGTLLNYTVRPASPFQAGEFVIERHLDTPEKIVAGLGIFLDGRVTKIKEGALIVDTTVSNQWFIANTTGSWPQEVDAALEVEFLSPEGYLDLGCQVGTDAPGFQLHPNGEWAVFLKDQFLTGKVDQINQVRITCLQEQVTLAINGETVATAPYHPASDIVGRFGLTAWEGTQVALTSLDLTAIQGQKTPSAVPVLLNRVSLPPASQPGEVIFAWDIHNFFSGCGSGWWGRDPSPCWWTRAAGYGTTEFQHQAEDAVLVTADDNSLTLFTYRPDLYDQPVEISADVSLTSKGGGVALFCRATWHGRYEFIIHPDGKWMIRVNMTPGSSPPILNGLAILDFGTVENFSPESFQVNAVCSGNRLVFSLDDVELGRVEDTTFPEGQAGIFFDLYSEGSFTHLEILRAE